MSRSDSVYFVQCSRSILDDAVREDLTIATFQMLSSFQRRRPFHTAHCEGEITTDMQSESIGGLSGIACIARFSYKNEETIARFIMAEHIMATLSTAEMYAIQDTDTGEVSELLPNPIRDIQRRN